MESIKKSQISSDFLEGTTSLIINLLKVIKHYLNCSKNNDDPDYGYFFSQYDTFNKRISRCEILDQRKVFDIFSCFLEESEIEYKKTRYVSNAELSLHNNEESYEVREHFKIEDLHPIGHYYYFKCILKILTRRDWNNIDIKDIEYVKCMVTMMLRFVSETGLFNVDFFIILINLSIKVKEHKMRQISQRYKDISRGYYTIPIIINDRFNLLELGPDNFYRLK